MSDTIITYDPDAFPADMKESIQKGQRIGSARAQFMAQKPEQWVLQNANPVKLVGVRDLIESLMAQCNELRNQLERVREFANNCQDELNEKLNDLLELSRKTQNGDLEACLRVIRLLAKENND